LLIENAYTGKAPYDVVTILGLVLLFEVIADGVTDEDELLEVVKTVFRASNVGGKAIEQSDVAEFVVLKGEGANVGKKLDQGGRCDMVE
jgi:hypothetical protein